MSKSKVLDWNQFLKNLWIEYKHPEDLKSESTTADFDISHQRNWRNDPRD